MPRIIRSNQSTGEDLQHVTAIRLRASGAGNLEPKFYSLDDARNYPLVNLNMTTAPGKNLDRLANVAHEQRVFLELKTTEFNATMRVNRIIVYMKPTAAQYPG